MLSYFLGIACVLIAAAPIMIIVGRLEALSDAKKEKKKRKLK